ncbi:MAG: hypothetical protein IJU72_07840, partial [Bacteroidales bacterium]|nr:hypothetical protein [Bacteroidales bacterium]
HFYDFNKFFTTPQIKVYRYDKDNIEQRAIDLFATTIHELAHASHWEMCYDYGQYVADWFDNGAIVPESWATCIEHVITNNFYPPIKSNYGYDNDRFADYQKLTILKSKIDGYTGIFIDCIDNYNQREVYNSNDYPSDRVSGFTLSQIENAIKFGANDTTAHGLAAIIKGLRQFDNPTNAHLEELFSSYRKLK